MSAVYRQLNSTMDSKRNMRTGRVRITTTIW
jgi:hypothetical protein